MNTGLLDIRYLSSELVCTDSRIILKRLRTHSRNNQVYGLLTDLYSYNANLYEFCAKVLCTHIMQSYMNSANT